MQRLERDSRATVFVVAPVAGPELYTVLRIERDAPTPTLIRIDDMLGTLSAADVLEKGTKRIRVVDGTPLLVDGKPVFVPVFEAGTRLGDLVDACLYFGRNAPTFVDPPPVLQQRPDYILELQRRRSMPNRYWSSA